MQKWNVNYFSFVHLLIRQVSYGDVIINGNAVITVHGDWCDNARRTAAPKLIW
jgi:hypothetical protein